MSKLINLSAEAVEVLNDFLDKDQLECRIELISAVEDHYFEDDNDSEAPQVLSILKCLRYLKQDLQRLSTIVLPNE